MVVTRYQIIKALGNDFEDLIILDIVSPKMQSWLECYEAYLKTKQANADKKISMRKLAEERNIALRTLYNIINFMETG
ncbi:MAG: hypothetical protein ACO1N9_05570 [Flavobacterium sp.]